MTFQVSDVAVNDPRMRQTVLAHGVRSAEAVAESYTTDDEGEIDEAN